MLVLVLVLDYPVSPTRSVGHAKDLLEEVHAKELLDAVHTENLSEEVHTNSQESEVRRISKDLVGTDTKGAIFQI